jgi:hypothetical protein
MLRSAFIVFLLGGVLAAVSYGVLSDYLSRRRMRRNFMPPPRKKQDSDEKDTPAEQQDTTG